MTESELVETLDTHDALVVACIRGELDWPRFEAAYHSFYVHHALDGHEADAVERALLAAYADRIALHRQIWSDVISRVTTDEHARNHAGYLSTVQAVQRIRELARDALSRG